MGWAGTAGQGYEGASSSTSHYCCGGGGASEAGTWGANSSTQADGGDGKSSDILGTVYLWSGGGGGAEHSNPKGSGGKGGGGVGAWGAGTSTVGGSPDTNGVSDAESSPGSDTWHQRGGNAGKHTGGGGGGGARPAVEVLTGLAIWVVDGAPHVRVVVGVEGHPVVGAI